MLLIITGQRPMTEARNTVHNTDIVIIGGGIAGLWLLNRLCNTGYNAVLLESKALGSDQTVASQGMIHGGIKYTLGGALTGASEAIADMPDHWRRCLAGEGDVNLSGARILSDHFYLWSSASVTSRFTTFVASKATRGRVDPVSRDARPPLLDHPRFKGNLYKLVDMVLDVPSVVKALAGNYRHRIYLIDWQHTTLHRNTNGVISLESHGSHESLLLNGRSFIFSAGQGNEELLNVVGATSPQMQLRPLQQVMVWHRNPHTFYGHCLGTDTTPRLTISSHPMADGAQVWYLGGSLAEKGASQTAQEVIKAAKVELAELMPWVDLSQARWATLPVQRAEPRQRNFARPDKAFATWVEGCDNLIAAWPTKLTLSPNLATEVLGLLDEKGIGPSGEQAPVINLPAPPLAETPWQEAFGNTDEDA